MAVDQDNGGNVKRQLAKLFEVSLKATVPDEPGVEPLIAACTGKFGDYQCNNAMGIWSKIKGKQTEFKGPPSVGQAIMKNLPPSEIIESCSVAGPGFVNVILSKNWMANSLQRMLIDGIDTWAPRLPVKRAVVDFSSPNIAKEMHVGHLRSTIIGDTLARMLEFSHVEVLRRNHVGDWGTQGDVKFAEVLEKMGAEVSWTEHSVTVTGPPRNSSGYRFLQGIDVNMNKMPDVAMTLAVVALFANGTTIIRDVASWRVKETERMVAICTELRKLGATVEEGPDYCVITPPEKLNVTSIDTYDDHRMAMAFSLAACADVPVTINDPGCTRKTFPDYFDALGKFTKH